MEEKDFFAYLNIILRGKEREKIGDGEMRINTSRRRFHTQQGAKDGSHKLSCEKKRSCETKRQSPRKIASSTNVIVSQQTRRLGAKVQETASEAKQ